jgi:hypothetical protein
VVHRDVCHGLRAFPAHRSRPTAASGPETTEAHNHPHEHGFGMVEVLVAITLLVTILLPVSALLARGFQAMSDSRLRVVAANLATQQLEKVRGEPFTSIPQTHTIFTQTVGGIAFTVAQDAGLTSVGVQASDCTAPTTGGTPNILLVTETVSWTNERDIKPVAMSTLISPPVGYFQPNTGQIGVSVTGASNQPQPGVTVTAVGPSSSPQTYQQSSSQNGCAYFANLPPGNYTVTLGETGYVSDQDSPSPSQTASVVVAQTTELPFLFDQAATFNFSFTTTAVAPATGMPITIGNSHLKPVGWISTAPGATSLGGIYPWSDGFSTWAGDCEESDPQGTDVNGQPLYPGATLPPPIDAPPGGTVSAPVGLNTLLVSVTDKTTGNPISGATLSAVEDGTGCTGHTYGMTTTDSTGTSSTGMPLGQFLITVTLGSRTASVYVWITPSGVYPESAGNQADPTGTVYSGPVPVQLP